MRTIKDYVSFLERILKEDPELIGFRTHLIRKAMGDVSDRNAAALAEIGLPLDLRLAGLYAGDAPKPDFYQYELLVDAGLETIDAIFHEQGLAIRHSHDEERILVEGYSPGDDRCIDFPRTFRSYGTVDKEARVGVTWCKRTPHSAVKLRDVPGEGTVRLDRLTKIDELNGREIPFGSCYSYQTWMYFEIRSKEAADRTFSTLDGGGSALGLCHFAHAISDAESTRESHRKHLGIPMAVLSYIVDNGIPAILTQKYKRFGLINTPVRP